MNPNKIEAIQKIPLLRTRKEIKSFLGITGYYRKFIKDYSKIAYDIVFNYERVFKYERMFKYERVFKYLKDVLIRSSS